MAFIKMGVILDMKYIKMEVWTCVRVGSTQAGWNFNCFVRDGCGIELDEFVDRFGMRTFIHVDVTPKASSFDKPH